MKKIIVLLVIVIAGSSVQAQFNSAFLQASGLTCAMCSKAIDNSLKQLAFIESVKPDIKNAAFNIVFKENAAVDIDALKKAVFCSPIKNKREFQPYGSEK
jgi:copper chaperone CopZ